MRVGEGQMRKSGVRVCVCVFASRFVRIFCRFFWGNLLQHSKKYLGRIWCRSRGYYN